MPRQINLADTDFQLVGNLLRRPFFPDVTIENLKLFRIDLFFRARNRGFKQILFPILLPNFVKIDRTRIRHALDRRRHPIVDLARTFCFARLAFSELIDNSPTRDLKEPAFEGTYRRIVFQFVDLLGNGDDGFLHHFLRFGIGQAGFARS